MRERARSVGGTVDAGPVADGWRVSAELPPLDDERGCGQRDPRRARRRPGAGARGTGTDPRLRGRPDDRRPVCRRRAGARRGRGAPARRRRDGHPDAGHERHRGDPADPRRRGTSGADPDDVRRRRNALGRDRRRRRRFRAQGRLGDRFDPGGAHGRQRRRVARPAGHPARARDLSDDGVAAGAPAGASRRAHRPGARRVAVDRRGRDERRDRRRAPRQWRHGEEPRRLDLHQARRPRPGRRRSCTPTSTASPHPPVHAEDWTSGR